VTTLTGLGVTPSATLLVVASLTEPITRASRNVPWLTVEPPAHVSVYQLMRAHRVVFEREALRALEEALSA
jgi:ribosomal protein L4